MRSAAYVLSLAARRLRRREGGALAAALGIAAAAAVLAGILAGATVAKDRSVARLDADFQPGTMTAVTGPSGSGKSTLLALLAGLDTPDEGEVVVDGIVLSELDREARAVFRRDRIGVLGQTPGLSGMLDAAENIELALSLRGIARDEARERAIEALELVGLAEHAGRAVGRLSAGERERVALARAIAARPAVLVADEPTARLDSVTTLSIAGLLADLARDRGTTVICATHDPLVVSLAGAELRLRRSAAVRST